MNRSVIIVKDTTESVRRPTYRLARVHEDYGQPLADWINTEYGTYQRALDLVWEGHRSSIEEPHRGPGQFPEHQGFWTLRDAKAWCEHVTCAYHNGKGWAFTDGPDA